MGKFQENSREELTNPENKNMKKKDERIKLEGGGGKATWVCYGGKVRESSNWFSEIPRMIPKGDWGGF